MDAQTAISVLMGFVTAGVGWWVKNIWSMVIAQQAQITALQVELARNYIPRAEMQDTLHRIFDKLEEIQKAQQVKP